MGCEWLAGLVWEGLGGLGMGCAWLVSMHGLSIRGVDCTAGSCMCYEWLAGLVWEGLGYM